ncbi:peptidyl-prolyl cis-trans isomerase C [Candidatus Gastranaerophilus sp. (ex Termes propinquus)]|nr:peptidyl-prolyl cis-trans isomerase C [Candidatus Gastranaerophilus sp. (ex Termes propinquus)]
MRKTLALTVSILLAGAIFVPDAQAGIRESFSKIKNKNANSKIEQVSEKSQKAGKTMEVSEEMNEDSVKASHILVDSKEKADELKARAAAGESFDDLAKEFSKCPSKERGGDLGYFGKGQMVPEFEQAAFATGVGEVSEPVQTQFGWHLIKVADKKVQVAEAAAEAEATADATVDAN